MKPSLEVLLSDWPEHALLDCGRRRKLERFGPFRVLRPEPKAWWLPALPDSEWAAADAVFDPAGRWRVRDGMPREWPLRFAELTVAARLTDGSKHLGVFPEQSPHWEWARALGRSGRGRGARLLSLFGYTGVASLAAAAAGFQVTHVDASKPAVAWARRNQALSGLDRAPIRWLVEDAARFVRREARRGRRYEAIVLDPPSFGRGPSRQVWKVEDDLAGLLADCRTLLSEAPLGILLTLYNLEASALMAANLLADLTLGLPGRIVAGELALRSGASPRVLPLSIFARWEAAAHA